MSISPTEFYNALENNGVDFFTGVPDSLLKYFCLCIDENQIMENIHIQCVQYGSHKDRIDYIKGANIAGFIKVADAMLDQGCV